MAAAVFTPTITPSAHDARASRDERLNAEESNQALALEAKTWAQRSQALIESFDEEISSRVVGRACS
jgi:hypothetical protein